MAIIDYNSGSFNTKLIKKICSSNMYFNFLNTIFEKNYRVGHYYLSTFSNLGINLVFV